LQLLNLRRVSSNSVVAAAERMPGVSPFVTLLTACRKLSCGGKSNLLVANALYEIIVLALSVVMEECEGKR
jgi:hypothetical protein